MGMGLLAVTCPYSLVRITMYAQIPTGLVCTMGELNLLKLCVSRTWRHKF
jgi:hypothetical protein